MEDGKICYAIVDDTCMLKLTGSIVYRISPCFDRFLQKVSAEPGVEKFVVDLTGATHIDSTNLGLLARLHEYSFNRSGLRPTVISTKENINEVLKNIGFAGMFTMVETTEPNESEYTDVASAPCDRKNLSDVMLNAHRELAKLNETNKEKFRDVIKYLEEETLNNLSLSR